LKTAILNKGGPIGTINETKKGYAFALSPRGGWWDDGINKGFSKEETNKVREIVDKRRWR